MTLSHRLLWFKDAPLFAQYKIYRGAIFIAIALSLAMADVSSTKRQVHHDEFDHVNAARYYFGNWLPPTVADPRARNAISIYGMSYLDEWDVVYPLAGKFAVLVRPLVHNNDIVALRLFNVTLFLILGCIALFRGAEILALAILLTSPQIWYVFGYFNGDAFPLFVSMLAAIELTAPRSLFNDRTRSALIRYLPLGIYIGLLVLSKKSFWAFGLFAAAYAAWFEFARPDRSCTVPKFLKGMGALAAIIFLTSFPRIAYDLYLNGTPSEKLAKIAQTAEALAAPIFKPSTESKPSLNLRRKGIGIIEMMQPPLSWGLHSAATSFGTYNYNQIWSKPLYYQTIVGIYALFLLYLIVAVARHGGFDDRVVLAGAFLFSCLVVGLSIHHSWVGDFQPQGRYLFAIFVMVAIVLARSRNFLNPLAVNLFLLSCFCLSIYSFVSTGLGNVSHFRDLLQISDEFRRPE